MFIEILARNPKSSIEGHGIAEALVRISKATAVEADVLRFFWLTF